MIRLALAAALAGSMIVATGMGAVVVPPATILRMLIHEVAPGMGVPGWSVGEARIILSLRLPRVLLGAIVGAGLGVAGSALQAITRNPLADPYLFGVSSGASVGAVFVILYAGPVLGVCTLPVLAFFGALGAAALVFGLARDARGMTVERLVLTGVAVHFMLMAVTNGLILSASDRGADSALFWMLGSFAQARWNLLPAPLIALIIGTIWVLCRAEALDALSLGDEGAHTLGISVGALRLQMLVATSVLTGALVAVSGAVGFVGLIMPHAARRMVGARMRAVVPAAALLGAIFAVWVDAGGRALFAPRELPLGVAMAAIGGVFFIVVVRRRERAGL